MAGRANLQRTNWSFGQMSHRLLGRSDLDSYRSASLIQENWLTNKSGSLDYRSGSRYVLDLDDTATRLVPLRGGAAPLVAVLIIRTLSESVRSGYIRVYGVGDPGDAFAEVVNGGNGRVATEDLPDSLWAVTPRREDVTDLRFVLFHPRQDAANYTLVGTHLNRGEPTRIPEGSKVSHGLYYEQRFVVGGPDDHPQTILGSRTPSSETGKPRYTDWTRRDDVSNPEGEVDEDGVPRLGPLAGFRVTANVTGGDTVTINKGDEAFSGDIACKGDAFRFGAGGSNCLESGGRIKRTVAADIVKAGEDNTNAVTLTFTPELESSETVEAGTYLYPAPVFEVNPDHSFEWVIDSGSDPCEIQWMAVYDGTLVLGCDIGIAIAENLSPDGAPSVRWHSQQGVARIQPAVTSFGVVAVGSDRQSVFEVVRKRDLLLYNEDLFLDDPIKEIAWLQQRLPRLWAVTESGRLFVATIHDPNRVLAWMPCPREGKVISICALRGGGADTLYLIVDYGGERVLETWNEPSYRDPVFADGAVVQDTVGTVSLQTYAHMTGRTLVAAKYDLTNPLATPIDYGDPSERSSLLTAAADQRVVVGFPINAKLSVPPIDESIDPRFPGSGLGQLKRMSHLVVGAYRAHAINAGPTEDLLSPMLQGDEVDTLLSGDFRETMDVEVQSGSPVIVTKNVPTPATLTYLVAEMA